MTIHTRAFSLQLTWCSVFVATISHSCAPFQRSDSDKSGETNGKAADAGEKYVWKLNKNLYHSGFHRVVQCIYLFVGVANIRALRPMANFHHDYFW